MSSYVNLIQKLCSYFLRKLNITTLIILSLLSFCGFTSEDEQIMPVQITTFKDLSDEIKVHIFQALTFKQRALSSQVNKQWNRIADDPAVWKVLAEKKYALGFDWLHKIKSRRLNDAIKLHVNLVYLFVDINKFQPRKNELSMYNKIRFDINVDNVDSSLRQIQIGLYTTVKKKLEYSCISLRGLKKILLVISLGMVNFSKNPTAVKKIIEEMSPWNDETKIILVIGKYYGIFGFQKDNNNLESLLNDLNHYKIKYKKIYDAQSISPNHTNQVKTLEQKKQKFKALKTDQKSLLIRTLRSSFMADNNSKQPGHAKKIAINSLIHPFGETISYLPQEWLRSSNS